MNKPLYATTLSHFRSLALLRNAKSLSDAASETREHFAKIWKACEGYNRFPISGGICAHWPEGAKDAVTSLAREANAALDESFREWKAAGRRRDTWMREKEAVFGPGVTVC